MLVFRVRQPKMAQCKPGIRHSHHFLSRSWEVSERMNETCIYHIQQETKDGLLVLLVDNLVSETATLKVNNKSSPLPIVMAALLSTHFVHPKWILRMCLLHFGSVMVAILNVEEIYVVCCVACSPTIPSLRLRLYWPTDWMMSGNTIICSFSIKHTNV